jgi:hypothetical protein
MIERFNFYDIYGYLLPGTLLFGLFWLPFGLSIGKLPTSEISATLLLLVPAYIAGHLLQTVANVVVSSDVRDRQRRLRAPSSILLDADSEFSAEFKNNLAIKVNEAFQIPHLEDDKDRKAAFFAARAYLVRNKAAGYLEQAEGMYAMMRGLGCAFYLGWAYLAGWGLSFHWAEQGMGFGAWCVMVASGVGALIASGVVQYVAAHPATDKEERTQQQERALEANSFLAMCAMLFVATMGYFLGTWKPAPARIEFFLWAAVPVMLMAGMRCLLAYRSYAENFAKTVWRDFAGLYGNAALGGIQDPD